MAGRTIRRGGTGPGKVAGNDLTETRLHYPLVQSDPGIIFEIRSPPMRACRHTSDWLRYVVHAEESRRKFKPREEENMPRPRNPRLVSFSPEITYFKPAGVPLRDLEEIILCADEMEALRLADLEALYQEDAAARMTISRPTFARLVKVARRKIADALVNGKAIRLEHAGSSDPGQPRPAGMKLACAKAGHGRCRHSKQHP